MENVRIIPYSDSLATAFSRLNKAWLEKYFEVEPVDEQMLGNPRQYYIEKGGFIFFAVRGQEEVENPATEDVVGTFALIRNGEQDFELSKMAVEEASRGQKTGHLMLEFAIGFCRQAGAQKIILYSHTKLAPAIHLYQKFGFREIPLGETIYKRSDIKMEKQL